MATWHNRRWFFGEIEAMKAVLRICDTWGYGNVMQVIANAWADKDPTGALTVGPCRDPVARRQRPRRTKRSVRREEQAMTVIHPQTVLDMLDEEPHIRVYQYRRTQTGQIRYVLFPQEHADDMIMAPDVETATLLYDQGQYTAAGQWWRFRLVMEEEG